MQTGIDQLMQIMRRDVGGHAHGDAGSPICQQAGKGRRKDRGFFEAAIVVGAKIDGVFVQAHQKRLRRCGHPRFGISGGSGVIAIDVAEVPLPVNERVANVEVLCQTGHRIIDCGIAVRVEVAHRVATDLG